MKTFKLTILTPFGMYSEIEAEYLQVSSEDYTLGILPGHSPLISTLAISTMIIKTNGEKTPYAIGGGIIRVEKDKVTLLLDSIECVSEIDFDRATAAKIRAEERLRKVTEEANSEIDRERAKKALTRALNRLKLNSYK